MKKILCVLDFESSYIRTLLKGMLKYTKESSGWSFCRVPKNYLELYGEEALVGWAQDWKVDAVIGKISNKAVIEKLSALDIPIMLQNYSERISGVTNITGDYKGTGEMAANYFLRKRYRNYAFYGQEGVVWSSERCMGYVETIAKHNKSVAIYNQRAGAARGDQYDITELKAWLMGLPKPIAIFACDDYFAMRIIEICRLFNIDTPSEVAVLGVDNDELMCNMSDPQLSSIVLDVENGGYQVAMSLSMMMEGQKREQANISIKPICVLSRRSTGYYDVNDQVVLQALKVIEDSATFPITVSSILDRVSVSRRVLERRFKCEVGEPIHQYIMRYTATCVAEELTITNRPVLEIASDYGIYEYSNLSRLFKRFYNVTPSKFRTGVLESL